MQSIIIIIYFLIYFAAMVCKDFQKQTMLSSLLTLVLLQHMHFPSVRLIKPVSVS